MVNKVGIIGCGKIFPRHLEAIEYNNDYKLVSVCDIDVGALKKAQQLPVVRGYTCYKEMIEKEDLNFIVVATPNSLHYEQSMHALSNGCDVLIEKPATLNPNLIQNLIAESEKTGQNIYCVLQVRLNSCIHNLKHLIDNNKIGNIRGVSLIQRWQRPKEYFYDWRGTPEIGGGILHECGIHYLDIMCYLLGKPNVISSQKYNTKHRGTEIEDTVYSIVDYGDFGGNIEVNISSEPQNLECSISIMTDLGFIKLGGKAMNEVETLLFLDKKKEKEIRNYMNSNSFVGTPNSYGSYAGSCPNHPELYKNIQNFSLKETQMVLSLISEIYMNCGIIYEENDE